MTVGAELVYRTLTASFFGRPKLIWSIKILAARYQRYFGTCAKAQQYELQAILQDNIYITPSPSPSPSSNSATLTFYKIYKGGLFRTPTEHKEQTDTLANRDERPNAHIKILERQGIAGVSHHSILFSKAELVQRVMEKRNCWYYNVQYKLSIQDLVDNNYDASKDEGILYPTI
ncbi:hypothetical protein PanWU01x14_331100 [Parasponia andersonii]|uniref:Uncharacterized protein n=1 Tax=Parasponia andersonii TaxID=3476 RepID=A0A2P5AHS6_PARAD|nr:hypothetical protein PanWU01x14_331100 [Parasponia andersonii]